MSNTGSDEFWMQRALDFALQGQGLVEPNPMVGCVIVRNGVVIGEGFHRRFGAPHAEVEAVRNWKDPVETPSSTSNREIEKSIDADSLAGATVYVTLEPCCHYGKTPPCSDLLCRLRPDRVVVAMRDPFPQVSGGGINQLQQAGIDVSVGVLESQARSLNAPYLMRIEKGLPWVIAKWASSLDGKIATHTGASQWISGTNSRALVHEWRGKMDAILVGIGTALADDPLLTARPSGPRATTYRVVVDSKCRLPLASRLAQSAREFPVLIWSGPGADLTRVEALRGLGCQVKLSEEADPDRSLSGCLRYLAELGCTNVMVEGGATLLGSMVHGGMVNEVRIFLAPMLIGGEKAPSPVGGVGFPDLELAARFSTSSWSLSQPDLLFVGRISDEQFPLGSSTRMT